MPTASTQQPLKLFYSYAPELGKVLKPVAADGFRLNEVLEVLRRYSLLRRNAETKTLSIHRLVQAVLTEGMTARMQRLWTERTVRAVSRVFPDIENDLWIDCERYLSQAQSCVELIDHYRLMFPEAAKLLRQTGVYLRQRARYKEAEPLLQRALLISDQVLGPEHPETASTLHELATLYQEQGKYEQAEPLYQRALRIREQVLGHEHPDTAITRRSYASLLRAMKREVEAEKLEGRAEGD